jgi:hypothetical protein
LLLPVEQETDRKGARQVLVLILRRNPRKRVIVVLVAVEYSEKEGFGNRWHRSATDKVREPKSKTKPYGSSFS